jgi:hypothetical protein
VSTNTEEQTEVCTLHIQDSTGDTRIMWNPKDKDEVAAAEAAFNAAKGRGMLAYAVDNNGEANTGEVIRTFDKKRGKIIMVPQTVGG